MMRISSAGVAGPYVPLGHASETDAVSLGGWHGQVSDGALEMSGSGETDDWWRVVAVAAWRHLDATGGPVGPDGVAVPE